MSVYGDKQDNYLNHERGFRSWFFTLDHKRIGLMYLVGISGSLLLGGFFALLVRTELLWPKMPGKTNPYFSRYEVTAHTGKIQPGAKAGSNQLEGKLEGASKTFPVARKSVRIRVGGPGGIVVADNGAGGLVEVVADGDGRAADNNGANGKNGADGAKRKSRVKAGSINYEKGEWSLTLADEAKPASDLKVDADYGIPYLKRYEDGNIMGPGDYNRAFTLHGAILVFLFIIPGIPAIFGNFILPIMVGAKDVAFPRLNLFSFHLWTIGAIFFLVALVSGGLDTGWTFYTPYSTSTSYNGVLPALFGVFMLGFSSIFTGLNFIVTVHKMRQPGMGWFQLPLFVWGIYATGVIQILATPVLGITVGMLMIERIFHVGIFDHRLGGDPVLFQHFFWFYSHPAVYIMVLPSMGVISELISTFSHKRIFGYKFIAWSSLSIALFGFFVWGHHMFVSGQSTLVSLIFSFLTFFIAVPSAIKVFNWLATLYKGSISFDAPMIYGLSFLVLFTIGGLTGLFLATLSTDIHLHSTYFVVAHFHYVMVGSMMTTFLGALNYWWPKMFGRMYNATAGRVAAVMVFLGFNLTFLPQFVMGTRGAMRRYFNYFPEFTPLQQLSTAGAYLLASGVVLTFIYLLHSLFKGKPAPDNPWGSNTLEWRAATPPSPHNFDGPVPHAGEPYDVDRWTWDEQVGGFVEQEAQQEIPVGQGD